MTDHRVIHSTKRNREERSYAGNIWINLGQQGIWVLVSKEFCCRSEDSRAVCMLFPSSPFNTEWQWKPVPVSHVWGVNRFIGRFQRHSQMLCIVSHHPTWSWQLLPAGAARDAALTTPQPQLILIIQTLPAAIPALLGEVTDSSL